MNKTVRARVGEKFKVPLEGNPTTGFRWEVEVAPKGSNLVAIVRDEFEADTSQPGAPAIQLFEFQAIAPGTLKLVFHYRRAWEKIEPREERIISVTIKP